MERGQISKAALLWGLTVPGSKTEAKGPHPSALLELGTLPSLLNMLQGLCMQMKRGSYVGAEREGRGGEGGDEDLGLWDG